MVISKGEIVALVATASLIWVPLLMAPGACADGFCGSQLWHRAISGTRFTDWLEIIVFVGQLMVFMRQAGISDRQAVLMDGQLKATQTAADAALASLERPWLVIEGLKHNQLDWLTGKDALIAEFHISNYGKAPAFIKGMQVFHFRGPDSHNGRPPFELPNDVLDLPSPDGLGIFIGSHQRPIQEEENTKTGDADKSDDPGNQRSFVTIDEINFAVAGGASTKTFRACGYRKLDSNGPGIHPLSYTESYLMGTIYYEIPAQSPQFQRFCYKGTRGGGFELYRDYAPYNESKKA